MNIRQIIRESLSQAIDNGQLFKVDGFKFIDSSVDENNNIIWKYSKKKGDYTFNLYIAKTPQKNWYYKLFVYWKKHSSNSTDGKGKDFDLQFGPFISKDELQKDLTKNIKHNILFAYSNYDDDNKLQLNKEIYKFIDKIKDVYETIMSCENSYFDDLKEELPNLFKSKPEVDFYLSKKYPDEDDKQQLLLILSKIGSLRNLKEIETIKSLF